MTARRAFIASALSLTTLSFAGFAKAAGAIAAQWRPGVNYRLVANPQAPTVATGKVEVLEAFWYGCGHCFALDPVLEEWNEKKPDFIQFVRVPVIWGAVHRQHAKLHYTLLALRRPELHAKVFEGIHTEGLPLSNKDDLNARALQFAFLQRHGVTEQQFDGAYDSMMVAMNMQRAENLTRTLAIDNVPTVYVNGKYATSVSEAGGDTQLLQLIDNLAESEKR